MAPTPIFPPGKQALFEQMGYSPALRSGAFLFVSDQVGVGDDGKVVEDPEEQMRLAFQKVFALIHQAGMSKEDVVDMKTYHANMTPSHQATFMKVTKEFFDKPPFPAVTGMVEVNRLAMEGLVLEVAVTAHCPSL